MIIQNSLPFTVPEKKTTFLWTEPNYIIFIYLKLHLIFFFSFFKLDYWFLDYKYQS